ncbi:hypothetical protein N7468_001835 [Penicillium chermesinum]|uniref:Cell wall protein n=1 Tax=Penicillium chermesinum TaxID=63820 RepID=A0A9W9PK97_9EURO|nr:uncharacterized protein N7468_001835 [Penicillium chermesinum]KAJ5246852.1 hypothetical protein N7468_001835 [Penicillium chermesinum]
MRFSVVASTLALISAANAAVSAQQMVTNIDAITSKSSETNDIAKTISITNLFSTVPQVINKFRGLITIITQDNDAMESKRSLMARQECLNVEDIANCLKDLEEIISDPAEILGGEKKKRQSPGYSDTDQV